MLENKQMKPVLNLQKDTPFKSSTPGRIPRGALTVPSADFISSQIRKRQINVENGQISIKEPNPMRALKELSKIILIHRWQKIKDLDLFIENQNYSELHDEGLKALGAKLRTYSPGIKNLNLELSHCNKIQSKGENLIYGITRHFTQLQHLKLSVNYYDKFTDEGLGLLASEIAGQLPQLKYLNLYFGRFYHMTDKGFQNLASKICKNLKQLEHLELYFAWVNELSDKGIAALGSELARRQTQIRHLKLSFHFCQKITDQGVASFGSAVARLTQLEDFKLDFQGASIDQENGVESFVSDISTSLKKLRYLHLGFTNCGITDKRMEVIANEIGRNLTELEQLTILFTNCYKLTDNGIEAFGTGMTKLTKLQSLEFDFNDIEGLTEVSIEFLGKQLASLTQLKKLRINVGAKSEAVYKNLRQLLNFVPQLDIKEEKPWVNPFASTFANQGFGSFSGFFGSGLTAASSTTFPGSTFFKPS